MPVLKLTGARETAEALRGLEKKQMRSIVRKGLRAGAKLVVKIEREEAPKGTKASNDPKPGKTRRSVGIVGKRPRKGKVSLTVKPRSKPFKTAGTAFYPAFVIPGHKTRSRKLTRRIKRFFGGKEVPPNDFPARAYARVKEAAAEEAARVIEQLATGIKL